MKVEAGIWVTEGGYLVELVKTRYGINALREHSPGTYDNGRKTIDACTWNNAQGWSYYENGRPNIDKEWADKLQLKEKLTRTDFPQPSTGYKYKDGYPQVFKPALHPNGTTVKSIGDGYLLLLESESKVTTPSLVLEYGKRYYRRDGRISDILVKNNITSHEYRLSHPFKDLSSPNTYTPNGIMFSDKITQSQSDLISEYIEPQPTKFKLELGKQYIRSDKAISGVLIENPEHEQRKVYKFQDPISEITYTEDGRIYAWVEDHQYNLVSEYIEPAPVPVVENWPKYYKHSDCTNTWYIKRENKDHSRIYVRDKTIIYNWGIAQGGYVTSKQWIEISEKEALAMFKEKENAIVVTKGVWVTSLNCLVELDENLFCTYGKYAGLQFDSDGAVAGNSIIIVKRYEKFDDKIVLPPTGYKFKDTYPRITYQRCGDLVLRKDGTVFSANYDDNSECFVILEKIKNPTPINVRSLNVKSVFLNYWLYEPFKNIVGLAKASIRYIVLSSLMCGSAYVCYQPVKVYNTVKELIPNIEIKFESPEILKG